MRRLFILRHAEAVSAADDRARPLSVRGRHEAEQLGQKMRDQKLFPDYVVCSPSRRTRETFAVMEKFLPETACIFPEYLYNAGLEDLVRAIRNFTDSFHNVLVIGHNPGLHILARSLAQQGDHSAKASIAYGFRPCAMAVFECSCETWAEMGPSNCRIVQVHGA